MWRSARRCVVFPGYVFERGFREGARDAQLFCVPTEVGCAHRVILEGTAARNCVLVSEPQYNAPTVRDAALGAPVYEQSGPSGPGFLPDSLLDHGWMVLA